MLCSFVFVNLTLAHLISHSSVLVRMQEAAPDCISCDVVAIICISFLFVLFISA